MTEQASIKSGTMKTRYLSLDVFRGLTLALMIVVNNPGSWSHIYAPFAHAEWHGFTLTDLIFPTFLFVVGNALAFSMKKFDGVTETQFLFTVLKRTLIIFAIGLFLNIFPFFKIIEGEFVPKSLSDIRIWGVLQRIAVCYGLASLIIYYFKRTTIIRLSVAILFLYWGILYYFGDATAPYSLEGNAVGKLDLILLNAKNLYHGFGIAFDPEGLLSTLPAVVNVIAGYLTAQFIQKNGNNYGTVSKLLLAGIIALILAQLWNLAFPINKPIWTSSYVLYTIGWDLIIIGILIYLIEVLSLKKWTYFFEVFGKNTLFIYALSGMLIRIIYLISVDGTALGSFVYQNFYTTWLADKNASLLFAFSYMLLLWVVGYILDKKKVYIKV